MKTKIYEDSEGFYVLKVKTGRIGWTFIYRSLSLDIIIEKQNKILKSIFAK